MSVSETLSTSVFLGLVGLFIGLTCWQTTAYASFKQFAVGSKTFAPIALGSTIASTLLSGVLLAEQLYLYNASSSHLLLLIWSLPLGVFLVGHYMVPRLGELMPTITLSEGVGKLYGKTARKLSALGILLFGIVKLAFFFRMMAYTLAHFDWFQVGVSTKTWAFLFIIALALLALVGGIRALMVLDLLQTFVLFLVLALSVLFFWYDTPLHDLNQARPALEASPKLFKTKDSFPKTLLNGFFCLFPILQPHTYQRIVLSKHIKQASRAFSYAAIGILLYISFLLLIHTSWQYIPHPTNLSLWSHISDNRHHFYTKIMLLTTLLIMSASSAGALLHTLAITCVHDLISLKTKHTQQKWAVCLAGGTLTAISLGLASAGWATPQLLFGASIIFMGTVGWGTMMPIWGFRPEFYGWISGVVFGLTGYLIGCFAGFSEIPSLILSLATHSLGAIGWQYLYGSHSGRYRLQYQLPLLIRQQKRQQRWRKTWIALESFSIFHHFYENLPKHDRQYFWVGAYIFSSSYLSLFFVSSEQQLISGPFYFFVIFSVLLIAILIFCYPAFPKEWRSKRWMAPLYTLGLGYVFFVASVCLAWKTYFPSTLLAVILCHTLAAGLLFNWQTVLGMLLFGPPLGFFLIGLREGWSTLPTHVPAWNLPLTILLVPLIGSFLIAILRKQVYQTKMEMGYEKLNNQQRLTQLELQHAESMQYKFVDKIDGITRHTFDLLPQRITYIINHLLGKNQTSTLLEQLTDLRERLKNGAIYLNQALYQAKDTRHLFIESTNLDQMVADWIRYMKQLDDHFEVLVQHKSQYERMDFDKEKLISVLSNAAVALKKKNQKGAYFSLTVEDALLHYPVLKKQVEAVQIRLSQHLPVVAPPSVSKPALYTYQEQFNTHIPGVAPYSIRYIDAHYGVVFMDKDPLSFVCVLPKELKKIASQCATDRQHSSEIYSLFSEDQIRLGAEAEIAFWQVALQRKYNVKTLKKAFQFMLKHHHIQLRKSGAPFYTHPLIVANKVMRVWDEEAVVVATLMHDVSEDSSATISEIAFNFGNDVATLVDLLTKLKGGIKKKYLLSPKEVSKKIREHMDRRVACIKLCDRIHNLETLDALPKQKQERIIEETIDFYIPLAEEARFSQLKKRLEHLIQAFKKNKRTN